ncbi:HhH-GDP family DNA glycosylase [Spelaeicoccus albus]|uniref:Endonuclease n=1 Tax=Spelaeicoccus albus TaxID=1280376 RepID=A0A7Z0D4I3_9MICO|nr:endonuclease [Spelaeicoccus albus]NYI68708.1 hypothetical protein [Spelaeicoccus albus]
MTKTQSATAATLLAEYGSTYAHDAGIRLKNTPAPLYQLLVLSHLLSARISSDIAVSAARALFKAGFRTPAKMAAATWQQRVDALGEGHYRRYDERTSTQLGDGAEKLLDEYSGDLRKLRSASASATDLAKRLRIFPGIGPTGAHIFCREVQGVWPDVQPFIDKKVHEGANRLQLPTSAEDLARLVEASDLPRLAAGCVRVALDPDIASAVKSRSRGANQSDKTD